MQLVQHATRNLLFTGKGGVGKTSLACAAAIALSDEGKRVLLVSTDPASNLDEVLGVTLGTRPMAVPGVHGLFAMNIDPEQAAKEYRDRVVAPYRELLPQSAVQSIEEQLSGACTVEIARSLIGVDALRDLAAGNNGHNKQVSFTRQKEDVPLGLAPLISDLAAKGSGVILTMGKGGVGKTTIAAQIAVALAGLGHSVHLTTTDPAAHVQMALASLMPNLRVSRIDPVAETVAYAGEIMAEAGGSLDDKGRALLEEDLRSPCTEEIAVFRAFSRLVDEGNCGFVVIDTAPTGHTLLLLDAAEAYHRDVERNLTYIPDSVRRLLPQLRNPDFTRILIVTLPEATPVHEAARLQDDLRRAGIIPFAWVINQSLAVTETTDPVLAGRAALEHRYIGEVRGRLANRVALIPWLAETSAEETRDLCSSRGRMGGRVK